VTSENGIGVADDGAVGRFTPVSRQGRGSLRRLCGATSRAVLWVTLRGEWGITTMADFSCLHFGA
jgi:hypothetical protein